MLAAPSRKRSVQWREPELPASLTIYAKKGDAIRFMGSSLCCPTLNYTAYYPLCNVEKYHKKSQIAKNNSYLFYNTHDIKDEKY
jgi:hypothetical protein